MRKIVQFIVVCSLFVAFSSCGTDSKYVSCDERLLSVLKSRETFIAENNNETYLDEFVYGNDDERKYYAQPQKYSFVDFDNDGINELVVDITTNRTYFMVFHIYEGNVYGFLFGCRSMQLVKKDGTFEQTGSADTNYYCKMQFAEGRYSIINIAVSDSVEGVYEINGEICSQESVDAYIKNWKNRKNADWVDVF